MHFDIFDKKSLSKIYVERYWTCVTSVYRQTKTCIHTYIRIILAAGVL